MAMMKATEVTPARIKAIMPVSFKDMPYAKPTPGQVKIITKVAYNVYVAKKDGNAIVRKDGTELMNCTAYVGFDDGTYFTFKNEIALGQLMSITGDIKMDAPNVFYFEVDPCTVKILETTIQMGKDKKSYPSWVFEPQ